MVRIKRIYEEPAEGDGTRVLVDRLWPRGVSKEKAKLDKWLREIAPSDELRKWFGHDPARWEQFQARYLVELKGHQKEVQDLIELAKNGVVTLLYAARDEVHNEAQVILTLLQEQG